MKINFLTKSIGATALALSLAVLPSTLSASAQTNTGDPSMTGDNTTTTTTADDDGFDWGWLGLLGLLGLAGLKGRDRSNNTTYSDRVTTPSSTTSNPRY
ncbi:MAG TPA: WGxxGxxG family protein [Nodosilinea sp.]|jgi:hypothetical protein|nr:WGxxGxxG family protein [Nodosilinea sp.]